MWCERAYRSFSSFAMGKKNLSLSVGVQLLLSRFCCGKWYSITTWELRDAKTHPLLQPLELCNNHHNLLYAHWSPWLTFLVPPTVAATYPVFVTSHNLLAPFSHCEQTPGLPLSHRDWRTKLPLLWLSLLSSWYCFLWGDPAALPYLLLRRLPGKQIFWVKSPLKGAGQHLRPLISQVSPLTMSISSTNAPAFPRPQPGRGFCLLNKEKCCEAWGSGCILVTLLSHHLLNFFGETHCEVSPSFFRDI